MQAIFRKFFYEIVTLTFRCFHNLSSKPSIALLSLFFSLFSFQGTAFRLLLKPDQNIQSLEYFDPSSPGGDSRDRTGDLLLARQALSQLS